MTLTIQKVLFVNTEKPVIITTDNHRKSKKDGDEC